REGLPIDAGIVRRTSPFLLTVKVCVERLATPSSASPVSKPVVSACTPTDTWVWAGQYWAGTHCTTLFSTHSKCPVALLGEVTRMDRSAARRSVTGAVNVTTTGCATPTTAPSVGKTEATAGTGWGTGTAAWLRLTEPVSAITAITPITNRKRTARRITLNPSRRRDQHHRIVVVVYPIRGLANCGTVADRPGNGPVTVRFRSWPQRSGRGEQR